MSFSLSISNQHKRTFTCEWTFSANYRPQTKLRKGNVFTPVCQSFCSQGTCIWQGVWWGCSCVAGRACVAGGHAWQGAWVGEGACVAEAGGMHGRRCAWQGGVHDKGGHAWQERRSLQRTVRILLEWFLVLMLFFSDVFDCFL